MQQPEGQSYRVIPDTGEVIGARGNPVGCVGRNGYVTAPIREGTKWRTRSVHRLVWEAVHGPIPRGLQINHKNGIKTDNRIANLELVTASENVRHAIRNGHFGKMKLGVQGAQEVVDAHARGECPASIADRLNVDLDTVMCVLTGRRWYHSVDGPRLDPKREGRERAARMRALHAAGMTTTEVAHATGVTVATASRVLNRLIWR